MENGWINQIGFCVDNMNIIRIYGQRHDNCAVYVLLRMFACISFKACYGCCYCLSFFVELFSFYGKNSYFYEWNEWLNIRESERSAFEWLQFISTRANSIRFIVQTNTSVYFPELHSLKAFISNTKQIQWINYAQINFFSNPFGWTNIKAL